MHSYKLDKAKDTAFFSSPHYDVVSTELLKDGDVICVCNDCEELFLQSSWDANDKKCCKCGCGTRKNIDGKYFEKYRLQIHRVTNTRGRSVTTTCRRGASSVWTVNETSPTTTPVRRRPTNTGSHDSSVSAVHPTPVVARRNSTGSNNSPGQVNTSTRTISPQPYPKRHRKRKKTGRVLLGIVIFLFTIAILIGAMFALDQAGVIDLSPVFSAMEEFIGNISDGTLNIVPTAIHQSDYIDFKS